MYKILVVDDNADVRNTLRGFLADAGHSVYVAGNEGEAFIALTKEQFDFAIIDVRLHGEDEEDESGLVLAAALRKVRPDLQVILLTRYVRTKQIVHAIGRIGVIDFIDRTTQDWCNQILAALDEASQKACQPRFGAKTSTNRLSISLVANQHVGIRAHGLYVCSTRTSRVLEIDVERYARRAESAWKDPADWRFQVKDIGCNLWRDIFAANPEVSTAYTAAYIQGRNLLLLFFETPREFLRLPLEFIRSDNPPEYLVLQHPVARFVYNTIPKREALSSSILALKEKIRVLIIASNTRPWIDGVDDEARELHRYLQQHHQDFIEPKLIPTEQATYERVREELRNCKYDIIHYAGHGSYNIGSPEESSLYFWARENRQGEIIPMTAAELKMLLGQSEVRLVYLSCCYGTATGASQTSLDDDFLGLADAVAQAGVPSVLGFRWPVSDDGARRLALAFYKSLLEQGSPEIALWNARCELAINRNDTTWLSPVLIHQV
jgi:ActR/RegA family two-component response regulator